MAARNACTGILLLSIAAHFPNLYAQNLLTNPNFDTDYAGWGVTNPSPPATTWVSSPDHTGGQSGSVQLKAANPISSGLTQCIAVNPGYAYTFGFWNYQASGQACSTGTTGSEAGVSFWYDSACTQSFGVGGSSSPRSSLFDQWEELDGQFVAPLSVHSIGFDVVTSCGQSLQIFQAFVDDAFLMSDTVFRSGFE